MYDEANSTFIEDPDMAKRLMDANPSSFRKLVSTCLQRGLLRTDCVCFWFKHAVPAVQPLRAECLASASAMSSEQ